MYSVISIDNLSKEKWGRFVYEHPNGNVFQTPEMYEVYRHTKNYEPVFIGVSDSSGEIAGSLLSVIQREFGGPLGILSSRCVTWGGPLVREDLKEKEKVLNMILKELNKVARKKALYMEFRNLWDMNTSKRIFESNGYVWEDHLDILIDLTKSEEELWRNMKKSRRRGIKKAIDLGLSFEIVNTEKDMEIVIKLIKDTYLRKKLLLSDESLFRYTWKILYPKKMARFFIVKNNEVILGGRITLTYKNLAYAWYVGSLKDGYKYHALEYFMWKTILWCKKEGYKIFDMGGGGDPNKPYGPRDFKLKFGGKTVNFGRYKNIYRKRIFKLIMNGLELIKGVKK